MQIAYYIYTEKDALEHIELIQAAMSNYLYERYNLDK